MTHATWRENRDGELFFIDADSTAAGWATTIKSFDCPVRTPTARAFRLRNNWQQS
jgi:hypothetical protein